MCHTAEHGFSQDFIAIVTDAPLDEVVKAKGAQNTTCCDGCDVCVKACPANALRAEKMVRITLNGIDYKWIPTDGKACDWSKKYALCGEEGHKYTGSDSNFEVPAEITEENLADAMKKADRILSYRPTTVHRCVIECPLVQKR
jgi:epoxyqueuosine reductase QueG